jgi:maltooligosyltrehalose trehalohydrolase
MSRAADGTAHALETGLGAHVDGSGVTFTVWAPRLRETAVVLDDGHRIPLRAMENGYFSETVPDAHAGQRYWFTVPGGRRPDPTSRFQPEGPSGPSMVIDPAAFPWTDADWAGAPLPHRHVLYELHVGTFTRAGTWDAARQRLPALARLGVTTLEIMPIAEFPGTFGWGYDGVFLCAPYHRYGDPDAARRFVDGAHRLGLAVILDVVYNHLGPSGSVLHDFSDWYFSQEETEWGRGFNVDGEHADAVRLFMRANVRHWVREYHFDGLRFDATHAIADRSPEHIVSELARCARAEARPRRVFMVAENEPQDIALLRTNGSGPGGVDALWNEDWHHAAFVALTGDSDAYFTDYEGTASEFAAMARWNLLYQGQWYSWQRKGRGTDARDLSSSAFVCFLENHDQVANTGRGLRLHQFVHQGRWRAAVSLLLLGPSLPMLFQGQESATGAPFTYFADHDEPLAEAVRAGRLEFLSQFPALLDPSVQRSLPDPADASAFRACRLEWPEGRAAGDSWRLHRDLIALRRSDPVLQHVGTPDVQTASAALDRSVVLVRYRTGADERMVLVNLGPKTRLRMNDPLLAPSFGRPWVVRWCSEHADYGGRGMAELRADGRWALQAHCAWLLQPRSPAEVGS